MSGGYEYNLTTQSQFEQMKQKNHELLEQNYSLKKTLQDLIKVNNELSQTIEEFNNSALAMSGVFKNQPHKQSNGGKTIENHDQCGKMIQELGQQVQYFKNIAYEKMNGQENSDIINALESLIESFKQTQKYYEQELNGICEQVDNLKSQWESKIFKIEQTYRQKTSVLQDLIKQVKKKEQIVAIIEKKLAEDKSPRRLIKKNSQIDTSSQRKFSGYNPREMLIQQNKKQRQKNQVSSLEIEQLKQKQKKLNEQLKQKDKTIGIYTQLLSKLRKKLSQKY